MEPQLLKEINKKKIIDVNKPLDNDGNDLYNSEYFKQYNVSGKAIMGSVIAPQATTILKSGSINGYVWSLNLHQRDGAELHNFYNPWLTDEQKKKGTIEVIKYDDKDLEKLLAGAEFKVLNKDDEEVGR